MHTAEWQSVIVAAGLLLLIGFITVTAIRRYQSVDEALKVVAAFSGIIGVITGAFTTYFFTREPLETAREQAASYKARFEALAARQPKENEAEAALAKAKEVWGSMSTEVPATVDQLQRRIDVLSRSNELPKGITKDNVAWAKSQLEALKANLADAQSAAAAGDFTTAQSKAEGVKNQAAAAMKSLGADAG